MANTFKILLVGEGNVGKTTYVKRLLTGKFEKHNATLINIQPLEFNTNYGKITFNVWDSVGKKEYEGLKEEYYTYAEGCIVMYITRSRGVSKARVEEKIKNVRDICGNIPLVVCANKVNVEGSRQVSEEEYMISTKSNFNFVKPFLFLARKLTQHEDLELIEEEPITPPEVENRR